MTLDAFRSLFPHRAHGPHGTAYLDHAATGPLSSRVTAAMHAQIDARSRTEPNNFETFLPALEEGRAVLAELVGAETEHVEYAANTSSALAMVANGLDWAQGDRIAVPACEFPSNRLPWMALERLGVTVDAVPSHEGTFSVEDIARTLTPRTRLVAVSWVQFLSGFRADLAAVGALCRDHGCLFVVDAIQGLGALRMDVQELGIDALACGGQKWMLGPHGSAFFYLAPHLLDRVRPVYGWLNGPVDWDDFDATGLDLHPDATRFRTGTPSTVALLGLKASAETFLELGPETVEAAVLARAGALADGLEAMGLRRFGSADPAHASGIVTVEHPDAEGARAHLVERGVVASVRDRKLRLSPHAYTSDDDVARALDGVAAFGRTRVAVP